MNSILTYLLIGSIISAICYFFIPMTSLNWSRSEKKHRAISTLISVFLPHVVCLIILSVSFNGLFTATVASLLIHSLAQAFIKHKAYQKRLARISTLRQKVKNTKDIQKIKKLKSAIHEIKFELKHA